MLQQGRRADHDRIARFDHRDPRPRAESRPRGRRRPPAFRMTDRADLRSDEEADGSTLERYSRRELVGIVVMLWLAGSLSDLRTLRLLYGLQGFGRFGYGGHAPSEQ